MKRINEKEILSDITPEEICAVREYIAAIKAKCKKPSEDDRKSTQK